MLCTGTFDVILFVLSLIATFCIAFRRYVHSVIVVYRSYLCISLLKIADMYCLSIIILQ